MIVAGETDSVQSLYDQQLDVVKFVSFDSLFSISLLDVLQEKDM